MGRTTRWTTRLVLVLACAAISAARAEDESAPLGPLSRHEDRSGTVSVLLPERWIEAPRLDLPGYIQGWGAWIDPEQGERPHVWFAVAHRPGFHRAGLCGELDRSERYGHSLRTTVVRTDHAWQERRLDEPSRKLFFWRYVELGGDVFLVLAQIPSISYRAARPHVQRLIEGVRLVDGPPPPSDVPDCARTVSDDLVLWTDSDEPIARGITLDVHAEAWRHARTLVDGDPVVEGPPVVVLVDNAGTFHGLAEESGIVPGDVFVSLSRTAVVVRAPHVSRDDELVTALRRETARQAIRRHFGGPCPAWIDDGLAAYAEARLRAGTNATRPPRTVREPVVAAARRLAARLDDLLALDDAEEATPAERGLAALAWHWFLRDGPGAEGYGRAYRDHLAQLRTTGQPTTAREVWSVIDRPALDAAFRRWLETWAD